MIQRGWLLWCLGLAVSGAQAAEVLDRGAVELGYSASSLQGSVTVNGAAGVVGTDVDLSRDLDAGGHDRSQMYALRWRPYERHEFGLRQQSFERNSDRDVSRDLVFNGQTFVVNSRVRTQLQLALWSFEYTGWLIAEDRRAFGLSVGALQYRLAMNLKADNLPGGVQPGPVRAEVSADLPVLVLGAEYRQAIGERWRLVARTSIFRASVGGVAGTVLGHEAGLEYALTQHATLALRYVGTRLDAQAARGDLDANLDLDLTGLQTALRWRW